MAPSVPFAKLIELYNALAPIDITPGTKRKLFKQFVSGLMSFFSLNSSLSTLFPTIRLILPTLDRTRSIYGLKEAQLAKIVGEAFLLGPEDKKTLTKWKDPQWIGKLADGISEDYRVLLGPFYPPRAGDMASTLVCVCRNKFQKERKNSPVFTVDDVNILLEELVLATSAVAKRKWFAHFALSRKVTALEFGWICRIILKDLKLGLGEETALVLVHPEAKRYFAETFSLEETLNRCSLSNNGSTVDPDDGSLSQSQSQTEHIEGPSKANWPQPAWHLGSDSTNADGGENTSSSGLWKSAIRPMLAANLPPARLCDLFEATGDGIPPSKYTVEPKWDGERCILHIEKTGEGNIPVRTFSRNGYETSWLYAKPLERTAQTLLSKFAGRAFILDGEVLGWDKESGCAVPFAMTKPVALGKMINDPNLVLVFMIFDILYFNNGEEVFDLLPHSLEDRRALLQRITPPECHSMDVDDTTFKVKQPLEWGIGTAKPRQFLVPQTTSKAYDAPDDPTEPKGRRRPSSYIFLSPIRPLDHLQKINSLIKHVAARGEEGLMIKTVDGRYRLGSRSAPDGWFKCKPKLGSLGDSLDVYLIGAFLSNRVREVQRASIQERHDQDTSWEAVSSFLCAIRGPAATTGSSDHPCFFSLCKLGGGISRTELYDLNDRLSRVCTRLDPSESYPAWLDPIALSEKHVKATLDGDQNDEGSTLIERLMDMPGAKRFNLASSERPDFILNHPSNAMLVPVIAAELTTSSTFGCGFTLRFPRMAPEWSLKTDKPWDEGMSVVQLARLWRVQGSGVELEQQREGSPRTKRSQTDIKKPSNARSPLKASLTILTGDETLWTSPESLIPSEATSQVEGTLMKKWMNTTPKNDRLLEGLNFYLCPSKPIAHTPPPIVSDTTSLHPLLLEDITQTRLSEAVQATEQALRKNRKRLQLLSIHTSDDPLSNSFWALLKVFDSASNLQEEITMSRAIAAACEEPGAPELREFITQRGGKILPHLEANLFSETNPRKASRPILLSARPTDRSLLMCSQFFIKGIWIPTFIEAIESFESMLEPKSMLSRYLEASDNLTSRKVPSISSNEVPPSFVRLLHYHARLLSLLKTSAPQDSSSTPRDDQTSTVLPRVKRRNSPEKRHVLFEEASKPIPDPDSLGLAILRGEKMAEETLARVDSIAARVADAIQSESDLN